MSVATPKLGLVNGPRTPASAASSTRMKKVRRRDTKPEIAIRRALFRRGYRYRVDYSPEPSIRSRPDIVFTRVRLLVFVDGCFWHSCPVHSSEPKTNAEWWSEKLRANQQRDRKASTRFRQAGWTVLRVWEHEPVEGVVEQIESFLATRDDTHANRDNSSITLSHRLHANGKSE